MKTTIRTIIAMSLALFALSCAKELEQPKEEASKEETPSQELTSMTFTLAADDDASKTALGEDGKSVHFNTGDEISLFDGKGNRKFVANVHDDGSVSFLGEAADIETAQYKALYPYKEGASVNDGAVKGFCIPAEQTAVKGSFDPKANVSVAYAYEKDDVKYLRFVNVASLAKVVVPATDYKGSTISYAKITIEGNNHYNESTEKYDIPNDKVIAGGSLSVKTKVVEETEVKKETTEYEIPAEGEKIITLNGPITGGTYYIALYPAAFDEWQGFAIRAYDGNGKIAAFKNTYKANKFNIAKIKNLGSLNPTVPIPEPLEGVFSVSPTKKVRFAPGNLQYQASSGNWKFAEKQYIAFEDKDLYGNQTPCLDKDGNEMGQYATTKRDALPTPVGGRVTQDKWIDLFCFGCTGDATITKLGRGYMPWESWVGNGTTEVYRTVGTDPKNYYWEGTELAVDKHTDWGYVVTGTEENPWFTLSVAEWNYLLASDGTEIRDVTHAQRTGRIKDGITDKTCLYIRINIDGYRDGDAATGTWTGGEFITGALLLPDHFEWPAAAGREPVEYYNVPWQKSIDKNGEYKSGATAYSYIVAPNATRTDAAYSELEYGYLESAGCVFLPTTGYRHSKTGMTSSYEIYTFAGNIVKKAGLIGCYWTRNLTPGEQPYANALGFWPNGGAKTSSADARPPRVGDHYMTDITSNYRHQGYAVRLVKSCE